MAYQVFMLTYVLFVIGLIYAWRRYDLKRQRLKQQFELEQVETEKLKELENKFEMHDEQIQKVFDVINQLLLPPPKSKQKIGYIIEE